MKKEFMMLAHKYDSAKHGIGGWYMSEKLDGQRCYWDGGISRGLIKSSVPWANTAKDSRYVTAPVATGLWSRYGNVIHAPDWWLDKLPAFPLDGELYVEHDRQRLRTIISKLEPGPEWEGVGYHIFDAPPYPSDGEIKTTNFKKVITGCKEFLDGRMAGGRCFHDNYRWLSGQDLGIADLLPQERLPMATSEAEARVKEQLEAVTSSGGEGLMLRDPYSYWMPHRCHTLVKVKKLDDMEGTVIGYTTGRRTELGSKLLGKMGALILDIGGKRLELSGFTDAERELTDPQWAMDHPEAECPDNISAIHFPRGEKVTFMYRGLTNDGIPNEARYWRKYDIGS